jgi:hypothetical protein
MKIKNTILPLVLFIALPLFALAQSDENATEGVMQQDADQPIVTVDDDAVIVANVDLANVQFHGQNGRVIELSFDIVNRGSTVQPDVRYSVQLLQKVVIPEDESVTNNYVVDEYVYQDVIDLGAGKKEHRSIVYDVPSVYSGAYTIGVYATTTNGVPLALAEVQDIVIDENTASGILLENCAVLIDGDTQAYSIAQGVDIDAGEAVYAQCDVINKNDREMVFAPQFLSYHTSVFGELLGQSTLSSEKIGAKETRNMRWQVPVELTPQAYDAALQILDENGVVISNTVPVHYVIRGESGRIMNAQLDKDLYRKGDVAVVSFDMASRADLFFGSRAHGDAVPDMEEQQLFYDATIYNGSGVSCGGITDHEVDITVALMTDEIAITTDCVDPIVDVVLKTASGNVLHEAKFVVESSDEKEHGISARTSEKDLMQWIFYGVLIVTFIAIVVIVIMRKKINPTAMFFVLIVCGSMVFAQETRALTFTVPPPAPWGALGYAMYITANADPLCDATRTLITGSARIKVCRNAWINASVYIDGSRVLYRHCPGGSSAFCGEYSFSKWDSSRIGSNSARVRGLYELSDSHWNQERTRTLSYTVDRCPPPPPPPPPPKTLSGVLNVTPQCLPFGGGNAAVDLSVGSIEGTATGTIEYRYTCDGSHYSNWMRDNSYTCSYDAIGNKSIRAQIRRNGVTAYTNISRVNIDYCPTNGACEATPIAVEWHQDSWAEAGVTSFCSIGAPVPNPPAFPEQGASVMWDCRGINGGGAARDCTAQRSTPPPCACGSADNTPSESSPSSDLCNVGDPSSVTGTDVWNWTCGTANVDADGPGGLCTDQRSCSAECIDVEIDAPEYIYTDNGDSQTVEAKIRINGDQNYAKDINCTIGGQPVNFPSGSNTSDPVDVTVGPEGTTINASCTINVDCGNNGNTSSRTFAPSHTIGALCMQRSCTQQGTCQAVPQNATSDCSSTCSSDADCSSGRMIETRP